MIVDLHIHSHFARATSPRLTLEGIYQWGKIKGIEVIGTGDFTHPQWFRQITEKLEPAESGLYKLKDSIAKTLDSTVPESCRNNTMRFVPTVEISNIYSRGGRVRKVHNVIVMPSVEAAAKLNKHLVKIGNLAADGRPILGMDSHDLLLASLDADAESLFIPAHIWTPWFALFGSKSGFDSLEEAFGDDIKHVHAVETGLSSDPFMNWQLSNLNNVTIVSNSDAHSLEKLGREATIIDGPLSYKTIYEAIVSNDERLVGTIEFFPQEGKYHWDGHRKCSFSCSPEKTQELNGVCPECGRGLTIGVDNRIESLSDQSVDRSKPRKKVEYIIPMTELIAEAKGIKSDKAKTVVNVYDEIIEKLGNEFDILRNVAIENIADAGFEDIAHSIKQMRKGNVNIKPGYDGEYGVISVQKSDEPSNQVSLF